MKMIASQDRLYKDVEFLTALQPARNYLHPQSLDKVCDYLKNEFGSMGATPQEQTWAVQDITYKNIIASYNTAMKRRLVVGAHYDVAGNQPGADDNASAVAGLLETARMVFANQPSLEYRIDFVMYSLEEPPFFGTDAMGSYVHAKSLHDSKAEVMGMICYEMIGYFSEEPESQPFPYPELAERYPHVANFIIVVGVETYTNFNNKVYRLMRAGAAIDVQLISFPVAHAYAGLAGLSDQRSYWRFNYPALMINDTSFLRNPHYHQVSDTIDTLDFSKMAAVVDSAYSAIIQMA